MANYSTHTVQSGNPIKRWSHNARFEIAVRIIAPAPGESILDFGTGDAMLPLQLKSAEPAAKIAGYEPFLFEEASTNARQAGGSVEIVPSLDNLQGRSFDKVVCMEVMEHLPEKEMDAAMTAIRGFLRPGGLLIFAVPIEMGPSSLFKNIVRVMMRQPHEGTSLQSVFWSATGATGRIHRNEHSGYIYSHLGFNWNHFKSYILKQGLIIDRTSFSPVNLLGPAMNSQVFIVCRDPSRTPN